MPSYRFCRPDDVPYLVRAVNECYNVHFPTEPTMNVERFRSEMRHLDVWPSNSLVAVSGAGPVAVLIGTKRETEVLVLRIGVHPDHRRRGHGGHLLTSLSQKLAVLGPERLIAEAPRALPEVATFLEAHDYRRETSTTDYLRPPATVEPVPEDWVIPTTVDELIEHGMLEIADDIAWERRRETLLGRKDELEGLAIASPERLEAFLLYRTADDGTSLDILAAAGRESEQLELFEGLLLRRLAAGTELPLRFPKLSPGEVPATVLAAAGFEPGAGYDRFGASATPA